MELYVDKAVPPEVHHVQDGAGEHSYHTNHAQDKDYRHQQSVHLHWVLVLQILVHTEGHQSSQNGTNTEKQGCILKLYFAVDEAFNE